MPPARSLAVLSLSVLLAVGVFVPFSIAGSPSPSLPNLSGAITDTSGQPISGATVDIYTAEPRTGISASCPSCYADCGKHATTDAAGNFRIPSLNRWLVFRLLVIRDGYAPTFVPGIDPLQGRAVHVRLARAAASDPAHTVTGTVSGPDGQPVAEATVEPEGIKTASTEEYGEIDGMDPLAVTDEQGRFRFHCPQPDGVVYATVKARGLAVRVVSLTPGPSGAAVNRSALAVGTSIAGVVRDAQGHGISDVQVEVVDTDRSAPWFTGWQDIGTEADGRFLVPNVPAQRSYIVCAMMGRLAGRGLSGAGRLIKAGADGSMGRVNLTVTPAAAMTGRVTLSDGKAIPAGTRVMLNRFGTWDGQQAVIAPDGGFTFHGVPTGEKMAVYVSVRGYRYAVDTPDYDASWREVHFQVPAGTVKKNENIALVPAGVAAFTVRVSGTPGCTFAGTYELHSDSQHEGDAVNGTVPAQFTATTETLSVSLQKQGGPGTLKVEILKAGKVEAAAATDKPNGNVTAATR